MNVVWKKRIGTIRDSLPQLFQLPPVKIGVPGLGGSISTAGNVMFVGATQDNYLRAFNVSNGDKLWEARLPAGGQATPMTYEANGKQYVVIMADMVHLELKWVIISWLMHCQIRTNFI
jgi:quinoprotein glucose dehydrogenase